MKNKEKGRKERKETTIKMKKRKKGTNKKE